MERFALGVALALVLAGCSGVDIRPISPALEAAAHARDGAASGYVVYGPMVVVEVALREVCVMRNDKGVCVEQEARCAAGAPRNRVLRSRLPHFAKSRAQLRFVDLGRVDGTQCGSQLRKLGLGSCLQREARGGYRLDPDTILESEDP